MTITQTSGAVVPLRPLALPAPTTDDPYAYNLTDAGRDLVTKVWRENFVYDPHHSLSQDDVSDLLVTHDRNLGDVPGDEIRDWLIQLGAKERRPDSYHYAARKRDAFGVAFGPRVVQPVEWLVDGLIPAASVSIFAGAPKELKTWGELSLLQAVARAEVGGLDPVWAEPIDDDTRYAPITWLGRGVERHRGRCIAFDYEMGQPEVDRRLALLGDTAGLVGCVSHPKLAITDDAFWTELEKLLPLTLVSIDSLWAGSRDVNEKDASIAAPLQRACRFAQEHGTAFVFVHHSPKEGGKSLNEILRGSGAIAAAIDACFHFEAKSARSADGRERRALVTCKKMRRGGTEPDPFTVKLTDAGGLELVRGAGHDDEEDDDQDHEDEQASVESAPDQAPAVPDTERVYAAVVAAPGIGGKRPLSDAAGLPLTRTKAAMDALLAAGRVVNRGTDLMPRHYAVSTSTAGVICEGDPAGDLTPP